LETSADGDEGSGWPSASEPAQVKNHGNHQLAVQELQKRLALSIGSCHTILTEDLGMHPAPAKFVLRYLTDGQKLHPISIFENILHRANGDRILLKHVITCDEMCFFFQALKPCTL
jgi:hypothetical protein